MRTHRLVLMAALAAALAVPSAAAAKTTLHGTVVKRSSSAFVVAGSAGKLSLVHSARAPRVRRAVTVSATRRGDGTYSAARVRAGKVSRTARLRGRVAFRSARSFTLVANGAQVSVATKKRIRARTGRTVTVRVTIQPGGDLSTPDTGTTGTPAGKAGFTVEGTVTAIDTTAKTLTLTDQDGTGTLTVSYGDVDVSALEVGEDVTISVGQGEDGLTLLSIDSAQRGDDQGDDDDCGPGDDQGEDQGDDRGEHGGRHGHGPGDDSGDDDSGSDDSGSDDSGSGGGN